MNKIDMMKKWLQLILLGLFAIVSVSAQNRGLRLTPHKISLAKGVTFNLNLPEEFEIMVAAEGLKRARFMAKSPDNRIFVTDMFNLTDNKRGAVYILEDFNEQTGRFGKVTPYMTNLRNPNSICFHTDERGNSWFYLALTDSLVRYRYRNGDNAPTGRPQVLAEFPDYGLSYKYGGWHLTRTIAFAPNGKLYISVGSSCNACEEKEAIRASVIEMNQDGSNRKIYARGLRNAVGMKWVGTQLYVTNMGADHLGDNKPSDTMYVVKQGLSYGWPYCYQQQARIYADPQF
ncbi:MAG TPA: PQQ-dependent sugar dehydrogenase, partial [Pyrinomonadaceae bacterium]